MSRIPILNVYYLLCYAWKHWEAGDTVRRNRLDRLETVQDLLAKILSQGIFQLIRTGLDRGFSEIHEDIAGVRGRIDLAQTTKRALRAKGQIACVYEELSHDVLHNQMLRATLRHLLRLPNLDHKVRGDVRKGYLKLAGISDIHLNRRTFGQVVLDRNRRNYRFLLSVCQLIYDQLLVDETSGQATFREVSDSRLAQLFEDFVIGFYQSEQHKYAVNKKGRRIRWNKGDMPASSVAAVPRMEADVILEAPDKRIIMDTKFYEETLGGRIGGKLRSNHLYQLLAYLRNREATVPAPVRHDGILLYPTVDQHVDISVCLEGFNIRATTINLGQPWKQIRNDLLGVLP